MTIRYQDVVFAFDFSRIETVGGVRRLFDFSKNGFHMRFPGGAADPTPNLSGGLDFDGGDYLYYDGVLDRFYAAMPTREHTWLWSVSGWNEATGYIFSTYSFTGGNYYGASIQFPNGPTTILRGYYGYGMAVLNQVYWRPVSKWRGRLVGASTLETTVRGLCNQTVESTSVWAAGAFGTVVYDPAFVPNIGGQPANINARISYLALIRGAISSDDLAFYSRLISEGSTKPFCCR